MIRMLIDYVLVEVKEKETSTSSGIILTESTADTPCIGTVVSVGPGRPAADGSIIEHHITVGDVVLFPAAATGNTLVDDDKTYHVMSASQIFGIKS